MVRSYVIVSPCDCLCAWECPFWRSFTPLSSLFSSLLFSSLLFSFSLFSHSLALFLSLTLTLTLTHSFTLSLSHSDFSGYQAVSKFTWFTQWSLFGRELLLVHDSVAIMIYNKDLKKVSGKYLQFCCCHSQNLSEWNDQHVFLSVDYSILQVGFCQAISTRSLREELCGQAWPGLRCDR